MTSVFLDLPRARPLLLTHGVGWRVQLDGPALRVTAPRRAPGLVPIRAISRVLSGSDVHWDPKALMACMKAGAAVTFVDGHGNPQGYCHGYQHRESALASLLTELIDHPDWDQRYADWLSGMHSVRIRQALIHAGLRVTCCTLDAARSRLCQTAHQRCERNITALLHQIDGNLHALVLEQLQRAITQPRFLGHPRPGLSFVNDFSALLHWSAYALLKGADTAGSLQDDDRRLAAHLANSHAAELTVKARSIITVFELWLREWSLEEPA